MDGEGAVVAPIASAGGGAGKEGEGGSGGMRKLDYEGAVGEGAVVEPRNASAGGVVKGEGVAGERPRIVEELWASSGSGEDKVNVAAEETLFMGFRKRRQTQKARR